MWIRVGRLGHVDHLELRFLNLVTFTPEYMSSVRSLMHAKISSV
jgi:hypothetical protein